MCRLLVYLFRLQVCKHPPDNPRKENLTELLRAHVSTEAIIFDESAKVDVTSFYLVTGKTSQNDADF